MAVSHGKNWTSLKSSRTPLADEQQEFNSPSHRRFWGRRIGRPLGKDRTRALEKLLPVLSIPKEAVTAKGNIDPRGFFKGAQKEIWFEIGFGNGEHLLALKRNFENVGFIGAEPFINGMANLLKELENEPQDNIRVHMDDALPLIRSFRTSTIDRIYILNPDPWPKSRHHKRRIISQENLDEFSRVLQPGGRLILATDVDDLAEWMVTECMNHSAFEWTAQSSKDWKIPPAEWTETRYAFKGKQAGRRQIFLLFTCQKS